ncbi:MAG: LuxR C-terminal-related transcriptional regulator [Betaproteobacteria bacterium]|nr:LuxR C-terminal-related transcriptional regulator [Betaproteobacteria bacterium]
MKFTGREIQVLTEIARGLCNKTIARDLFISLSTVRKHRQNIYRKLDMSNAAQLTSYAIDHNYICDLESLESCASHVVPTSREKEVMQLVSTGLRNSQIALNLHVSYSTVRKHRENIHIKFGLKNSAEMTAYYKLQIFYK